MESYRFVVKALFVSLLVASVSCGGGQPQDQASARILANPYNSKVHGNVYHSKWKNLELTFPTRVWRVESGPYALHLVAKDRYSQIILGSRWHLFNGGSLEKRAQKLLRKLGMRTYSVVSAEPAKLQGLDSFVLTVKGQFVIDYFRNLRVDRHVRLFVTRKGRRLIWMAYVSTEDSFPEYLSAAEELLKGLTILSQGKAPNVG